MKVNDCNNSCPLIIYNPLKDIYTCTVVCRIFEYDCAFACVSSVFQDELKSKF